MHRRGWRSVSPDSASKSSSWPLPATPAIDTISPPRTSSEMLSRATAKGCGRGIDRPLMASRTGADSPTWRRRRQFAEFGADHQAREARRGLLLRIALGDDLAVAEDRRVVADRAHLLEPMADVEDGTPLRRQAPQGDEQVVGLLRRQHRGRLVHDDQFGLLQQAADDLDPLALADRKVGDDRVRIERQAVFGGDPGDLLLADRRGSVRRRGPARCSRRRSARRTARNAGTPCRCRGAGRRPDWRSSPACPSSGFRPRSAAARRRGS